MDGTRRFCRIDRLDRAAKAQFDTVAAVQFCDMSADFRRCYAGEGLWCELQHGHIAASLSRRGSDLQPDKACTDDRQADTRHQPLPQGQRIVDVAEVKDARMRWF